MSLSSFLEKKDVKDRFRTEFNKPRFSVKKELRGPPRSKRYSLVGTAFDYLLRFYLQHIHPEAVRWQWVAEKGLSALARETLDCVEYDIDAGTLILHSSTKASRRLIDNGRRIFNRAWIEHERYLASGKLTDALVKSTIYLAQLDTIFRSGYIDENLGRAYRADVEDLKHLLALVDMRMFAASQMYLLNPAFGEASQLVGGADADLLIDDTLIDVKTTKNLEFRRDTFNQLMGYVVLHEISGIGELDPKARILKIGVYFARFGYLHVLDLKDIIRPQTFPDFVRWFTQRALETANRGQITVSANTRHTVKNIRNSWR
jgi:hypothetical protein